MNTAVVELGTMELPTHSMAAVVKAALEMTSALAKAAAAESETIELSTSSESMAAVVKAALVMTAAAVKAEEVELETMELPTRSTNHQH